MKIALAFLAGVVTATLLFFIALVRADIADGKRWADRAARQIAADHGEPT